MMRSSVEFESRIRFKLGRERGINLQQGYLTDLGFNLLELIGRYRYGMVSLVLSNKGGLFS